MAAVSSADVASKHLTTSLLANPDELASLDLGEVDSAPSEILSYRQTHAPRYPPEAIANGDAGWVKLKVLIDADGNPLTFVLIDATATMALVEAAIEAIRQWRFNPAQREGRPVPAWMEVPIGFFHERAALPTPVARATATR